MTQEQKICNHGSHKQIMCDEEDNPDVYNGYNYYKDIFEDTFVDISNSQYKCTKCNLIFNYVGGNPNPT